MHIVLTHEQADFDALASLLGAYLLDDSTTAVLPRRLNRNVRAFVTLYGQELPFTEARDVPSKPIEAVTLVDTQSPVTFKGMRPETRVHVVDHHPARPDLPPDWQITTEEIGAATTLFVEALQERNGLLSVLHATLLLLGIYEDTGSLTYTRTTPRDAQAISYLLAHGANLQIAQDFLNHPLSPDQQAMYEKLRAAAKTETIHGNTVVISSGDAQHVEEELSTLAHKLRDLLDPDALVLLFSTRAGVQLIARSTTDYIDVGSLAEHFGGGGHARAAAALIHDKDLEQVEQELKASLPGFVQPAVSVATIMSNEPHLLSPSTPVNEAAELMQRYGYEGFPVTKKGRVVGLLTRRAVDRALAHKLNLKTTDLMQAGEVTVSPEDSVETLQQRMIDSGWGQIPVIEPKSGEITGIVTRTDLLKTLAAKTPAPGPENLAATLEQNLPPARLALLKVVAEEAAVLNMAVYIVGGFVRDLMLEKPSPDFDLVVEGDAIALGKALRAKYKGRLTSHKRFGTAKWSLDGRLERLAQTLGEKYAVEITSEELPDSLDLVSSRREFYTHPSALPTVKRGSIKLDLHRRDFTINTLALRLDGRHYGELHDYWGAGSDIQQGVVRVLHSLSFVDDPTRILRAVRFEQRFGFRIAERTLELLLAALPLLDRVSGDRLRHELDTILGESKRVAMMARLEELGILKTLHPELAWRERHGDLFAKMPPAAPAPEWGLGERTLSELRRECDYLVWLHDLPESAVLQVSRRLKLAKSLENAVVSAGALAADLASLTEMPPSAAYRRLSLAAPLALYVLFHTHHDQPGVEVLHAYAFEWRSVAARTDGNALRARGLPPGPQYKQILETLRAAWLDGKIASEKEELEMLEKLLDG